MPRTRHRNDGLRKVCRCPRSAWTKCEHPWHFSYKWKGVHYRFSLDRQLKRRIDSKSEARTEANRLRVEIEAGKFGETAPAPEALTVSQLLDEFDRRYMRTERAASLERDRYQVGVIKRTPVEQKDGITVPFGELRVADVTTNLIERFREARRIRTTRKDENEQDRVSGGLVAANRNLSFLRAAFNWAIRTGYIERTPFKLHGEAVVKLSREVTRIRRLEGDEADRLLTACGPHLRALVEAALETGCRKGELLSMQWSQIRWAPQPEVVLPAAKTKARRDRRIPISSRLRLIFEMCGAAMREVADIRAGDSIPGALYIFGNEIGQRVASIKTAWHLTCARANIADLHFHDLRREAGSRWLEGGVPLQTVRDWLGHSNISQTSTYLESTLQGQHEAMRRFEERRSPVATTKKAIPPSSEAVEQEGVKADDVTH